VTGGLSEWRREQRISITEASRTLAVHPSTYKRWEDGRPYPRHLETIATVLEEDFATVTALAGPTPKRKGRPAPSDASVLTKARLAERLNRVELGRRLHVGPATVYRWERGRTRPPEQLLPQLAEQLSLTRERLEPTWARPPVVQRLAPCILYAPMPWAATDRSQAREIEEELLRRSTRLDRLMLDRFIAASRKARTAVVCPSERMMISNPAAWRIAQLGQPFVWEDVARSASSGTVTLPNGAIVPIRTDEILDGGEAVGLVIEFDLRSSGRPGSRAPRALPSPREEPSWILHRQYADARRLLVAGGPGVGKASFIRGLLASQVSMIRVRRGRTAHGRR
jgi:DNA-binding transcriptional regulator YiaG